MKKIDLIFKSFIHAGLVVIYVSGISWLMSNGQTFFGSSSELVPIFGLFLFIISATITSLLVFGKPILLYLEGLKREALILLGATLAWLIFFMMIILIILRSIKI